MRAKKSLGQHWLADDGALEDICAEAKLSKNDTVLEIGPGTGTLTQKLVKKAREVVAVELDDLLVMELPYRVPSENLKIIQSDILRFDFTSMAKGYKLVANIPYYLTSNLIRVISESTNPPDIAVLLVQREVAQRVAAKAGNMSLLSVTAQFYWKVKLGRVVPAELFEPPPSVDSQILVFVRRKSPLFSDVEPKKFFQLVKSGFANRRKTLLNSLSSGLRKNKEDIAKVLTETEVDLKIRPQELTIEDWHRIYQKARTQGLIL